MKTTPTVPGTTAPGVVEFDVKSQGADRKQQERNVRVHQIIENVLLERHLEGHDGLAGEDEGYGFSVETPDRLAVDLAEKILFVRSYVIDEMLRQRFLIGKRLGFAHCAFGDLHVASAAGNHRTHEGGGIVFDFLFHFVVGLRRDRSE
jgi:hypothetical protein